MEELETTNLPEGDEPEVEVETEVQDTEPQLDDDGNPIEDQADVEDDEELDIDGHKVKLPKSVAEKLAAERLMQADYTRKTQELAEQRKAFEAERQAVSKADAEEMSARANLTLIDHQLNQFSQVNWNAWNDQDPFEAQKAFQQFQLLKDAKQQTAQFLGQKRRNVHSVSSRKLPSEWRKAPRSSPRQSRNGLRPTPPSSLTPHFLRRPQ
jgi:hypothetical protein